MKRHYLCMLLLCCCLWPVEGRSDFYKYVDKDGTVRYTDNLTEVPAAYLNQIKGYAEAKDDQAPPPPPAAGKKSGSGDAGMPPAGRSAAASDVEKTGDFDSPEDLAKTKTALDREYADLLKVKKALAEERETLTTADEVTAYLEKVSGLNERISAFEQRRRTFQQKINDFNAGLTE